MSESVRGEDESGAIKRLTYRGRTGLWGLALLRGKSLAASVVATVALPW